MADFIPVIVFLSLFATPLPAAAMLLCPNMGDPDVVVEAMSVEPSRIDTQSVAQLGAIPGRPALPPGIRSGGVLGLTWVQFGGDQRITVRVVGQPDRTVCVALSHVHVRLGFEKRRIYVARELPEGTCIHAEVLAHERRHVQADDALLQRFLPRARAMLKAGLRQVRVVRAEGRSVAVKALQSTVMQKTDRILDKLIDERRRVQARIDTVSEYRRVSNACDGEIHRYLGAVRQRDF